MVSKLVSLVMFFKKPESKPTLMTLGFYRKSIQSSSYANRNIYTFFTVFTFFTHFDSNFFMLVRQMFVLVCDANYDMLIDCFCWSPCFQSVAYSKNKNVVIRSLEEQYNQTNIRSYLVSLHVSSS